METLWLVVGTVGMFAGTVFFAFLGISAPPESRKFYIVTTLVTLIAFVAYLSMANGSGAVVVGDRIFYQTRYLDWLLTTPLLLLVLALLSLASLRRNLGLVAGLVGLDVFMILVGWWAGRTVGGGRYLLWFMGVAAMVALLYLMVRRLFAASADRPQSVQTVFRTLAGLTVILWLLYPVVWLIGTEGIGAFGPAMGVFLFMVLDLLSKVGFGLLLLTNRQALADAGAAGAQASSARVV